MIRRAPSAAWLAAAAIVAATAVAIGVAMGWAPPAAAASWSRGAASLELSGSLLEQVSFSQGTDADAFAAAAAGDPNCVLAATFAECRGFDAIGDWALPISLTRLRTRLDLRANPQWSALIVYDHELLAGRLNGFGAELGSGFSNGTFLGAEQDIVSGDHASWRHLLYRGFVQFESRHFEASVGRQRIPWGVGRLWNPIDRFNAIPPLALQPDQSAGVDAVDLRWRISGFTFLEGVFAPDRSVDDQSYALRLHGVARDVDYSIVAGVFEQAWTLGFDLAGNLGGAAARVEFVYTDPERDVWDTDDVRAHELAPFVQVVASIDYLFDIGDGIYVLLESLYNGNGLGFGRGRAGALLPFFEATRARPPGVPAALTGPFVEVTSADRFGGSRVITRSEFLTGLQLGTDLTPELRVDLIAIADWQGPSGVFFPMLRYTPRNWLEISVGAQFPVGPRRSEYGGADPLGFVLFQAFY